MTIATPSPTSAPATAGPYTDRWLCSAAHLCDRYAAYVLADIAGTAARALGPAPGMDLVALARHARQAVDRSRRLRRRQVTIVAGTVLLVVPVVAASRANAVPAVLLLLAVAWAAGFTVLLTHRLGSHRQAVLVRDDPGLPRGLAPPQDPVAEAYLEEVMNANVVVFSGKEPFVGSGQLLARWPLHVNCTRPAQHAGTVRPFTAADLHRELTLAARRTRIPGLEVHNRLFVHGGAARRVPGLVPDPAAHPATRVGPAVLRAGITHPQRNMRTYLCLRKMSWDGDLVVEVFVRVERTAAYLFVEHHAFVLLPLREQLCAAGRLSRTFPVTDVLACARDALRGLLAAPRQLLDGVRPGVRLDWMRYLARRLVERDPVHDYGAETGLREKVASTERIGLFQYADEERDLAVLRKALLEAIAGFLGAHGIDTSEFDTQQARIVTQSITIGSINNSAAAFGAGNSVNQQQQPPGTPPSKAPWDPDEKP
ncbi:hypothetical protein [Actinoplanes sp. DH11]|uniref:hypothetical protein n=1 Tax=Actinoplanes sp. DH11 TaxID=2857011 RepID=UPI001E507A90|nr:hypothetical protein [Actinoplanes sp. DH11]